MARLFEQSDDWENEILTCPTCGWKGTFNEGDVEFYADVMDSSCPVCEWPDDPMLAILNCVIRRETDSDSEDAKQEPDKDHGREGTKDD